MRTPKKPRSRTLWKGNLNPFRGNASRPRVRHIRTGPVADQIRARYERPGKDRHDPS